MNIFENCIRTIKDKYEYKSLTPDSPKLVRVEVEAFVVDLARNGMLDRQLVGQLSDFMINILHPSNGRGVTDV